MDFSKIKLYYQLTKPGIIYGNLLTTIAGFLLASHWHSLRKLIFVVIGSALVVGGACVLNNIIDRDIDKAMKRTSERALAVGKISLKQALVYASVLEVAGCFILGKFTNRLTLLIALVGLFFYVVVYGWAKRNTVYSTLIGAISGALPPVIGYVSISGGIDTAAVIVFMMMVFWQLAHFYAIGLYREEEYKAAKLPIWPIVKGTYSTKLQILGSILAFCILSSSLFIFGYTRYVYLITMLIVGFGWFAQANKASRRLDIKKWGRRVFLQSLSVILITSIALAVGPILP